jgi:hypothetical protein
VGDAVLVGGLGAGRSAGAFGEDQDLAAFVRLLAGAAIHLHQGERAGPAVDRHHADLGQEPAEQRNPRQLALEDEGRVLEHGDQREGFEEGLVLGGDEEPAGGNALAAAELDPDAGHHSGEPQGGAGPPLRHPQRRPPRQEKGRQAEEHPEDDVQVEQPVEERRSEHGERGDGFT